MGNCRAFLGRFELMTAVFFWAAFPNFGMGLGVMTPGRLAEEALSRIFGKGARDMLCQPEPPKPSKNHRGHPVPASCTGELGASWPPECSRPAGAADAGCGGSQDHSDLVARRGAAYRALIRKLRDANGRGALRPCCRLDRGR